MIFSLPKMTSSYYSAFTQSLLPLGACHILSKAKLSLTLPSLMSKSEISMTRNSKLTRAEGNVKRQRRIESLEEVE
jgi:hypothetical protein